MFIVVTSFFKYFCKTLRLKNAGLVSSMVSFTSCSEDASLAFVGHPSSDGITIKIAYGINTLLH